ncbi:MAG: helix-turn-helix transcriptional regulator [candidate division Zixibacteria bacterium]|nr:helix-turn-helix transcriptional regulator [candidate division Zixibacteria bacterium]NIR66569.1 helix-turn-helix transcriptional regulator [candidate division Zixibacteria bacterium]NIS48134.1 helix-turn-helix transcriptional regulator [candidate division Zixibacteria bacterium]NIT54604.1 helix-turn-helix transcriptional regulator [candidate division Zixibacteria bacterium]NIU16256.1 helix-turn-helix transcriptional regulator [candidate division Zixibacteria bacterium]
MAIRINLDFQLLKARMSLTELASLIGITITNLSLLKNGRVKGIRFGTLNKICTVLGCQPGDILEFIPDSPEQRE